MVKTKYKYFNVLSRCVGVLADKYNIAYDRPPSKMVFTDNRCHITFTVFTRVVSRVSNFPVLESGNSDIGYGQKVDKSKVVL